MSVKGCACLVSEPGPAVLELLVVPHCRSLHRLARPSHQDYCCCSAGKVVVLVDDGLATGVTARAALKALRAKGAAKLVLAVPVGSARTLSELTATGQADEVVCSTDSSPLQGSGAVV